MRRARTPRSSRARVFAAVVLGGVACTLIVAAFTVIVATLTVARGASSAQTAAVILATFGISTITLLVAGSIAAWFAFGRLLSPIRQLRDTADAITLGDLGARAPEDGIDDIAETARTVNSMLDRLESSVGAQQRLLDDVRHELKTPITIVRGHLETMVVDDPADVTQTREIGIAELDRMTRLVEDIDLLATVESGEPLRMTVVDVEALTVHVAELVSAIPDHPWTLTTRAAASVLGDPHRLVQAWLQLADNAAKYTPHGAPIEIGSHATAEHAYLWVRDHGPGIPAAARHRVFQRFDRGNGRRTVGGSGLGLAIVDAIAKAHDGSCAISDTPGGGATFVIALPLGGAPPELPMPIRAGDVVHQREESE